MLERIELICGKRPEFMEVDIRKEEDFDKVFKAHPDIDSVIHFAALKVRYFLQVEGDELPCCSSCGSICTLSIALRT